MTQKTTEAVLPVDIEVVYPGAKLDPERDSFVPNKTSLFRADSFLPTVLNQTYETTGKTENLIFVSAGSSIGAEADTILALHNQKVNERDATMRGYDTSYISVNKARHGQYITTPAKKGTIPDIATMHDEADQIKKYGFDTEFASAGWICHTVFDNTGHYIVDATRVREGHDVRFQAADLSDEAPLDGEADMIVANNVLYHLTPKRATKFVRNLGAMLSDKAVLSLGSVPDFVAETELMRGNTPSESMSYGRWLNDTIKMLGAEFDLEYIPVSEPHEQPGLNRNLALFARH